uniref:(northern house mosquito) hypothetical protein n=1 Tax=Culex pipiens TaxID=7175 RepID=A0A8D8MKT9_CULPI
MVRYQSQGKSGSVPDHQPAAFPTSQCHDQGSKCGHRWGYGFAGEIHRPHHPRGRQLQRSHHAGRNLRTDPADRQRGKRVRRYPLHQRKITRSCHVYLHARQKTARSVHSRHTIGQYVPQ